MRLINRYNRVNALATIFVLLLSAVGYYIIIRTILIEQLDKNLEVEEKEIGEFVRENAALPEPTNYKDEQEEFLPTDQRVARSFKVVSLFNHAQNEKIKYRQLSFPVAITGKRYNILVRRSLEETEDLIRVILVITLLVVFILLGLIFLINRFWFRKLWKPFHSTLAQIQDFNLSGKAVVHLEKSDIDEFKELNTAVQTMTERVGKDYEEIKNFTENASHEIQTPLAIIKSKLELLSQSDNLDKAQMHILTSIFDATNRLAKLNQSLILLTKIDNRQFKEGEVNISELVNRQLSNYDELMTAKKIQLRSQVSDGVTLKINETLAEVLVTNLINNAIKHNFQNGTLHIRLTPGGLAIFNSGPALASEASDLFERFKKDKPGSESLGLGLSIVKKICERYDFTVSYSFSSGLHSITISFN